MVVSGFGHQYERTYPINNGKYNKTSNDYNFDTIEGRVVYITLNGPRKGDNNSTKEWMFTSSPKPSFGLLDLESRSELSYQQLNMDGGILDHFTINLPVQEEDIGKYFCDSTTL